MHGATEITSVDAERDRAESAQSADAAASSTGRQEEHAEEEELIEAEMLVEEISIDGMCGVY